jgi:FMN-dependent NADH-azoreductase
MFPLPHIDSGPIYGRSGSRKLSAAFVTQWKASQPDRKVIYRDLNATSIAPIHAVWVGATYTRKAPHIQAVQTNAQAFQGELA